MKIVKFFLVSVLCLFGCVVFAQTGAIKGKVIAYNWMFLGTPTAEVMLMQDTLVLQTLNLSVAEDEDFEFAGLEEGYYDVRVRVQAGQTAQTRTLVHIYVLNDKIRTWDFKIDLASCDVVRYGPCGGGQTHWVEAQETPTSVKLSGDEIRRMLGM